jgi:formylglycine-generating enzyme required for sulfatase activity
MDILKDTEILCMGCMDDKGNVTVCPFCGYDETEPLTPLTLPPRTQLLHGQYQVGRILGRLGGFGITYLGWDIKLETKVAVKEFLPRDLVGRNSDQVTIVPHHKDDMEFFRFGLERFLQEARTLAKFSHPNVVRVRTFFEENGTAYLVMDYYEGLSLAQYLKDKGGQIDEQLALEIMLPIMDGLGEVHEKGFLHRDIKPRNIYLTEGGIPILLDFGSARFAVGERSRSVSVVLSPGYSPYEQYHKKGKQGVWSDIYSVAATLYRMLAGAPPIDAADRIMEDDLEPIIQLVPEVSLQLNDALMQALAVKAEDRPQSIKEFQDMMVKDREHLFEKETGGEKIDTEEEELLIEYELTFEYKTKNSGVIVSTGALNRQGKEGVLVWEDDAYIENKFPRVYRNKKGFWEINLINRASLDFDLIMVYVPAGEFLMGSDERDAEPDELPVHNVFLHGYWLGKYEVTFRQFDLFCRETGLYINQNAVSDNKRPSDAGWGREERPVINVSWNDAREFCRWVSGKTALQFHLPFEAQWEKAARGTDNRRYSWGDRPPVKRLVNFKDSGVGKTVRIAQFPGGASPYGIMDMSGNVWEWCSDWYGEDYYKTSPGRDPKGPGKGLTRVKRGGSWDVNERGIRCSYRNSSYLSYRDYNLGFRLAMEV